MGDPFEFQATWETPRGTLRVRPTAAGDEADLLRFFRQRLSERSNFFLCLHRWQTDEQALEALRQRILAHQRREALVYVALHQNDIVGYFFLVRLKDPESRPPSLGIGLADAFQGCGIGGRFMDLLVEAARALGCAAIELTHHPDNHRAAALYLRKGFRYTGESVSWETPDGPRTEPRMRLELATLPNSLA
ncbi:MAG: GNAT family N-acetyltransferase [Armatimonadota bacterium]|nr:GNAT family N-acetyltransferase [Armatimonadota bacterium]